MARYTVKQCSPLEVEYTVRASRSRQTSYVCVNLSKLDVGWSSRVYTVQYRTQHLNQCCGSRLRQDYNVDSKGFFDFIHVYWRSRIILVSWNIIPFSRKSEKGPSFYKFYSMSRDMVLIIYTTKDTHGVSFFICLPFTIKWEGYGFGKNNSRSGQLRIRNEFEKQIKKYFPKKLISRHNTQPTKTGIQR